VAHLAGLGPFGELNFGNELRFHPGGVRFVGYFGINRLRLGDERRQLPVKLGQACMGEAGPGSPQYFHVLPSRTASSSEPKKRRSPLGTGVQIETTIANF